MTHKYPCCICDEVAQLVRCTQFAGDHFFCEKHGLAEPDFGKNKSISYWLTVREYNDAE